MAVVDELGHLNRQGLQIFHMSQSYAYVEGKPVPIGRLPRGYFDCERAYFRVCSSVQSEYFEITLGVVKASIIDKLVLVERL
jgi:hypothetical protein